MTTLISHSADLQVKVRNINLYQESLLTLRYMEEFIAKHKINIHVIAGDLFEYPTPNDDERKLIYNHLMRLLNIPTLDLLIIIDGNHDLEKENKAKVNLSGNNALSTIATVIETLDTPLKSKLKYFKFSTAFNYGNIKFLPYCLTNKENWGELKAAYDTDNDKIKIALYHAMLAEYAQDRKLPIKLDKLDTLDIFPSNTLVLAGDIHESFIVKDENRNVKFIYPGAPMVHTFGEGSYITVSDTLKLNLGKQKKFNIFKIDDNGEIDVAEKQIPYFVQYLTIQLNSAIDYSVLKHNIQQIDWDKICSEETSRMFVKIKSSNILIKQEREIFDMVKSACPVSNITIQFEYDKLIQKDTYSENPIIKEIIETNIANSEFQNTSDLIITSDNIDNLLLNKEQLTKLFGTAATSLLSKIDTSNISEIKDELLELFDKQLMMCMEQSSQRFNVQFQKVECNNFMILRDVSIDLTDTGITRILGTNGIGKTTLYRLIRWILTGTVMEGMKSNQVVQNNLLVFNKNLPDVDNICGTLVLKINNHLVHLTRSISRTWKKNTTEEQKLSQEWTDFISDTQRDFVIEFEGNEKKFVGANAEMLVERYFGNTINTLLFLDQAKIKSILNTAPDKLNEVILDYIGVDYLKKLEANLDGVKEDLMSITKPKIDKETVRENIIDTEIKIDATKTDLINAEVDETQSQQIIDEIKTQLADVNQQLEDIGNVENQLLEKKKEQENLDSEISKFVKLESKDKPIFDKSEPQKDNDTINANKKLIESKINQRKEFENTRDNLLSEINQNKTKLEDYRNTVIDNLYNKINEIEKYISNKRNEIDAIFNSIRDKLSGTLQLLNDKFQEKYEKKTELTSRISEINKEIEHLKEELKNGYCPTCKRQYDNFTEEHKNKIILQIKQRTEEIENINVSLNELNSWIANFNDIKNKYSNFYKLCTFNTFEEWKNCGTKGFENETNSIDNYILEINIAEQSKIECVSNLTLVHTEFKQLFNDYKYEINESLITSELTNIVNTLNQLQQEVDIHNESIKNNIQEANELNDVITNLESEYIDKFNEYKMLYNNWQKECEVIDKYNSEIQEKINYQTNQKLKLLDVLDEIKNLEKNKLPEYNKYKATKNELTNKEVVESKKLKEINSEITRLKLLENSLQNQKENKQKEYDNILKYEKNQIIWKIYSKLVKNNFKEIVFEYYRSFLNNTLNHLLSDVSFKLYWNSDSQLTMINQKNGLITYQPVQLSSGMETTFLGLSLIYCMHILNVKNSVSHLFIDEISGTLNGGKELSYSAENYQELFVNILFKFKEKSIFIVDHHLSDIRESTTYEVVPKGTYSIYERR